MRSEKQGSFLKGNEIAKVAKIRYVNEGFNQTLKCKVDWMPEKREVVDADSFETKVVDDQPESSMESIAVVKEKDPLKLLDFYE